VRLCLSGRGGDADAGSAWALTGRRGSRRSAPACAPGSAGRPPTGSGRKSPPPREARERICSGSIRSRSIAGKIFPVPPFCVFSLSYHSWITQNNIYHIGLVTFFLWLFFQLKNFNYGFCMKLSTGASHHLELPAENYCRCDWRFFCQFGEICLLLSITVSIFIRWEQIIMKEYGILGVSFLIFPYIEDFSGRTTYCSK